MAEFSLGNKPQSVSMELFVDATNQMAKAAGLAMFEQLELFEMAGQWTSADKLSALVSANGQLHARLISGAPLSKKDKIELSRAVLDQLQSEVTRVIEERSTKR